MAPPNTQPEVPARDIPVVPGPAASPVIAPNTDAPEVPPAPGLPLENQPGSNSPSDQNRQFDNPNLVLPRPPVATIPSPGNTTQIGSATPNGPPLADESTRPAPSPLPPPTPGEDDLGSGIEEPGGGYSLDAPGGVVYDMGRGLALANGAVTFQYGEFTVNADRGLVDYNTNRAILAGNLTVLVRGRTFRGNSLIFNIDTGEWRLSSLNAIFPPESFPPGTVLEPLYLRNGTVTGNYDTAGGQDFQVTSCDRGHYYIRSKRIEFYRTPGGEPSRIVLRRNSVYLLGRRVLPLPVYVISLLGSGTRRQPLQATFGQNSVDGFFARTLYNLRASPKLTDSVLVDALQKRGLGLGFQREYAVGGGLLYLYALSGQQGGREVNARVDRTYQLTDTINTNIRFDSSQNSSLLLGVNSQSKTQNGQIAFARMGEQAQTNAVFAFNNSSYGFSETKNGSIALTHLQDFGSGFTLSTNSLLSRSQTEDASGGSSIGNESATSDQLFTLGKVTKAFDLFLNAELHDDLVNNNSYSLERLPELTLQSTTDRLPLPGLTSVLPGSFSFGLGRFNEPSSQQKKGRADFFYTPRDKNYRLLGGGKSQSTITASGNFEQAFYSDDSARYNYVYNLTSRSTAGPAQLQVNYSKQRTFGFTPFQFDFFTPGEYIDYTFSVQSGEKFRFNLSGGRDIQNSFSRDLIARVQFAPNERAYASLGTTYRIEDEQGAADSGTRFGDIYANIRLARDRNRFGGGQLALGVRYSPNGQGLTRANGSLDVNFGKRTRFQALAGYDGYSKKFDFTQFRVTRDLHCFNLYATYDGQRREMRFDIAIKAFPFADTRFGVNAFSEGFDPSVGDVQ